MKRNSTYTEVYRERAAWWEAFTWNGMEPTLELLCENTAWPALYGM